MKPNKYIIGIILIALLSVFVFAGDYQVDENMNALGNDFYNITNLNATNAYQDGNKVVDESSIVNLSTNKSTYWGDYNTASDLNDLITIQGENITGGTVGESYLPVSIYTISTNGSKVDTGTVLEAYLPSSVYTILLNASKIDTGIIGESYLPSSLYAIALNGSKIDIGTVAEARIEDKFLKNYGDSGTGEYSLNRIILPQIDNESAPALAFGDGDSGIYEETDDNLFVTIAGSRKWIMSSSLFGGAGGATAQFRFTAASATNPTVIPSREDPDTGIGLATADSMSLIAGSVEGHRITESGGAISHILNGSVHVVGELSGAHNWSDNQNYPAACSTGYAITENGDSNVCTNFNIDGDTWLGNMSGGGYSLTNIDRVLADDWTNVSLAGSQITSGTVAEARLPSTLYTVELNGSTIDTGTVGESYLPSSLYTIAINGTKVDTGTVDEDRIEDKFVKNYGDTWEGDMNAGDNELINISNLEINDNLSIGDTSNTEIITIYDDGTYSIFDTQFNSFKFLDDIITTLKWETPLSDYGRVLYLPMNYNADDYSGNGFDGTFETAVSLVDAKIGRGYDFDGINGSIKIDNVDDFSIYDGHTISFWFNANDDNPSANQALFYAKSGTATSGFIILDSATNKLKYSIRNTSGSYRKAYASDVVVADVWYHTVCTWDGSSTMSLYIDGVFQNSDALTDDITASVDNYYIGGHTYDAFIFNGTIDDFVLYNRSFSSDEVKALYSQSVEFYGGEAYLLKSEGMTDSSSYWYCTDSDCNSTCQVNIVNGQVISCT